MKLTLLALSFTTLLAAGCEEKKAAAPAPAPAPAAAAEPAKPAAAEPAPTAAAGEPAPIPIGTKMKCAVTGEDFTVSAKTVQVVHNSKRYAFCCADCLPEFKKDPAKFAKN